MNASPAVHPGGSRSCLAGRHSSPGLSRRLCVTHVHRSSSTAFIRRREACAAMPISYLLRRESASVRCPSAAQSSATEPATAPAASANTPQQDSGEGNGEGTHTSSQSHPVQQKRQREGASSPEETARRPQAPLQRDAQADSPATNAAVSGDRVQDSSSRSTKEAISTGNTVKPPAGPAKLAQRPKLQRPTHRRDTSSQVMHQPRYRVQVTVAEPR